MPNIFHTLIMSSIWQDCELRLEKVIKSENRRTCKPDKDVMVKVVGNLTDGNFNLLSKVKGK